jgi:hypothetical protein
VWRNVTLAAPAWTACDRGLRQEVYVSYTKILCILLTDLFLIRVLFTTLPANIASADYFALQTSEQARIDAYIRPACLYL